MPAFTVVDLKMGAFELEFAGQMNSYLSAVNDILRHPDDQQVLVSSCARGEIASSPSTHYATSLEYPSTAG